MKSLGVTMKTLGVTMESLGVTMESLGVTMKSLGVTMKSLGVTMKSLGVTTDPRREPGPSSRGVSPSTVSGKAPRPPLVGRSGPPRGPRQRGQGGAPAARLLLDE